MPDLPGLHKIGGGNFGHLPIICAGPFNLDQTVNMTKETAPFGTWTSPISPDLVAGQSLRFGSLQSSGDTLYWCEQRPAEAGRTAIVACSPGQRPHDLIASPYSARSRVHEYGGGSFVAFGEEVYFINDRDQAIYWADGEGEAHLVAHDDELRCADFAVDPNPSQRRLVAVAEEHDEDSSELPENMLVEIHLGEPRKGSIDPFIAGRDFYAYPRFSPDGAHMCWIEWDLPWMPWEESRLMLGDVGEDGGIERMQHIAGGDGSAIFQPAWGDDGRLYFVSDETGWGNLYVWDEGTITRVAAMDAEFGRPLWGLGTQAYAVLGSGEVIASYIESGVFKLGSIDTASGTVREIDQPFSSIDDICLSGDGVAVLGTEDFAAPAVVQLTLPQDQPAQPKVLRRSTSAELDRGSISRGRLVEVPLADGGNTYAVYYPPTNAAFEGEPGTAPPLIAGAHGGPTGMADRGLKLKIQYWTSRGFAFVDVDYRGSFGYGTAYRDALNGHWGVRDVEDVIAATRWLVDQGLADGKRLLISGGSAGGYTVQSALTFHDVFAAGASYYGIGDLQKLLDLTHKFESGYIYNLTGTSPGETAEVFGARSPLFHAEQITSPVIFFQGIEDEVVPPGQSREMVDALKRQGIPVAYLEFEGEGHGFRQADTIVAALNAEYAFYAKVLGMTPREKLPELTIHNGETLS